jgi:hypothetical protein
VTRHLLVNRDWVGVWCRRGIVVAFRPAAEGNVQAIERRFRELASLARRVEVFIGVEARPIHETVAEGEELTRAAARVSHELALPENRLLSRFFDALGLRELLGALRDFNLAAADRAAPRTVGTTNKGIDATHKDRRRCAGEGRVARDLHSRLLRNGIGKNYSRGASSGKGPRIDSPSGWHCEYGGVCVRVATVETLNRLHKVFFRYHNQKENRKFGASQVFSCDKFNQPSTHRPWLATAPDRGPLLRDESDRLRSNPQFKRTLQGFVKPRRTTARVTDRPSG